MIEMIWFIFWLPIVGILLFAVWYDKRHSYKKRSYTEDEFSATQYSYTNHQQNSNYGPIDGGN